MADRIFRIFNPGGQFEFLLTPVWTVTDDYQEPKENPVERRRAQLRRAQQ